MCRAYDPWPGTFTVWEGRMLKLLQMAPGTAPASPQARDRRSPGTVFPEGDGIAVACGEGTVVVSRLQLEGRRAVTASEFLRGYPRIADARLGS
jgi:methionyl-tRNA formyltransferase